VLLRKHLTDAALLESLCWSRRVAQVYIEGLRQPSDQTSGN
jgi:hypothetical protein